MKIKDILARQILDSCGQPTVEVEVLLEDGIKALGQVPSGVSVGTNEAVELRDGDVSFYQGRGVLKAVANVSETIKKVLVGQDVCDQRRIDNLMIEADGTENKARLGSNAILAVSMAVCRAAARSQKIPLFQYFGQLLGNKKFSMPQPMILMLEGGKHGDFSTDIQEYMIIPKRESFDEFSEMLRVGVEIFYALFEILKTRNYSTGVGYEGAFCPKEIKSNEEAFQLIVEAVKKAGFTLPDQVVLGLDAAATEFYQSMTGPVAPFPPHPPTKGSPAVGVPLGAPPVVRKSIGCYVLKSEEGLRLTAREWTEKIIEWTKKYPIWSLEDIYDEEDWEEWAYLTLQLKEKIQVVGDDLLTTNIERIKKATSLAACNALIIKPNQIGTITETLEAIKLAQEASLATIISHRAGETNDDMIADLVVGTGCQQCKFGAPIRGERVAKYNRLLRIEEGLKMGE